MIPVKKLIKLIRFKQKDNNEIRFSDYDIMQALNECIRYVNQRFSVRNADFLEKSVRLIEDEINAEIAEYNAKIEEGSLLDPKELVDFAITGIELPSDFMVLVSIVRNNDEYQLKAEEAIKAVGTDTYKIVGDRFYSGSKSVTMLYRASINSVKNDTDSVMLPEIFTDGLVKVTGMILNNTTDTDVMQQAVDTNIVNLIPRRRYSNVRVRMPFYC